MARSGEDWNSFAPGSRGEDHPLVRQMRAEKAAWRERERSASYEEKLRILDQLQHCRSDRTTWLQRKRNDNETINEGPGRNAFPNSRPP